MRKINLLVFVIFIASLPGCTALEQFPGVELFRPKPQIIPQPQNLQWTNKGGFTINSQTKIVINTNADGNDLFIATQLCRKIQDITDYQLAIIQNGPNTQKENVIAVGQFPQNSTLASVIASWPQSIGKEQAKEGYILTVNNDAVAIWGFDKAGTFYGCQSLIHLLEHYRRHRIPGFFCYDYPDLSWRGMFMYIQRDFDLEFTKKIISDLMAHYKMNRLELFVWFGYKYQSHPEIYHEDNTASQEKLFELANFARQHFMEVIIGGPQWVHAEQWLSRENIHDDLVEDPNQKSQDLCPRNPKAIKLVRDLQNELIEMFNPNYIKIDGLSECHSLCSDTCRYCAGKDRIKTFVEVLKADRDYLIAKGITPIMWGDMLRTDTYGGKQWQAYKAINNIPKDIIIHDWDYSDSNEFSRLKQWKEAGLQIVGAPYGVGGGYAGKENIYNWAKAAKEHDMKGLVAYNKFKPGYKEQILNDDLQMKNLACFPYVAEWSWSTEKPNCKTLNYDSLEIIKNWLTKFD